MHRSIAWGRVNQLFDLAGFFLIHAYCFCFSWASVGKVSAEFDAASSFLIALSASFGSRCR